MISKKKSYSQIGMFFILFTLLFNFLNSSLAEKQSTNKNDKIRWLTDMNSFSSDYKQTEFTKNGEIVSSGKIVIKRPDKLYLENVSDNLNLKIISINNTLKVYDEDIGSQMYVDGQYLDLIKFLKGSINNQKLYINNFDEVCLDFNSLGNSYSGCFDVDQSKNQLLHLNIYIPIVGDNKKKYKVKIIALKFFNQKINTNIDDSIFIIKDNRIFDDEDGS